MHEGSDSVVRQSVKILVDGQENQVELDPKWSLTQQLIIRKDISCSNKLEIFKIVKRDLDVHNKIYASRCQKVVTTLKRDK